MNPYRRAERVATAVCQIVVISTAVTMVGMFLYYFVGFRWFVAAVVAFVLFMLALEEAKAAWRKKREAWDAKHIQEP